MPDQGSVRVLCTPAEVSEREIVLVLTEKGLTLHDRELIDNFERCD